ncbi:MAG TPA: hypothetical protein DHV89_04755 [Ruminococcus sp.]|nr:hypothetical protein [Ruminococcus sp.]
MRLPISPLEQKYFISFFKAQLYYTKDFIKSKIIFNNIFYFFQKNSIKDKLFYFLILKPLFNNGL